MVYCSASYFCGTYLDERALLQGHLEGPLSSAMVSGFSEKVGGSSQTPTACYVI